MAAVASMTWASGCAIHARDLPRRRRLIDKPPPQPHRIAQPQIPIAHPSDPFTDLVFTTGFAGGRPGTTTRNGFEQELAALELVAQGLTDRQIGAEMFLAGKTVKDYVSSLLAKLGLERRTQAAILGKELLGQERGRSPAEPGTSATCGSMLLPVPLVTVRVARAAEGSSQFVARRAP
jgi:DNA-binding CsgD family transcriptional regulator